MVIIINMDGNQKQGRSKIRAACCPPINSIQNQHFVLSLMMLPAAIPHETVSIPMVLKVLIVKVAESSLSICND